MGRDEPAWLTEVDRFLDRAGPRITRIDVPHGRHGFDVLDDSDESRQAVREALAFVADRLAQP